MPQQTRTVRLFVSSTFTDMREERKILQMKVFPELESFCEKIGVKFQGVDLRWGVNEESQLNQKTIDICMNEISRCQKISPKPNFLILLGDKYGWQPIPPKIPNEEMSLIEVKSNDEEIKLINEWYKLDTNAIPSEYVLQPRLEFYKKYDNWEPVEGRLKQILRRAIEQTDISKEKKNKYFCSATHLEILNGALNPPEDLPDPEEHVLVLFRKTENLPLINKAADYIDLIDNSYDDESHKKLEALKDELKSKLPSNCMTYESSYNNGKITLDKTEKFASDVTEYFKNIIRCSIDEQDEQVEDYELSLHSRHLQRLTEHFTGREDTLNKIEEFLHSNSTEPFALIGPSGMGKSSILAKSLQLTKQKFSMANVIYRFIGISSITSTTGSLLLNICNEILNRYNKTINDLMGEKDNITTNDLIEETDDNATNARSGEAVNVTVNDIYLLSGLLLKALSLATPDKPIILYLDAIDQLVDLEISQNLTWLPGELPPNCKIVVSALPHLEEKLTGFDRYFLPSMPENESNEILEKWFTSINRKLTLEQYKHIMTNYRECPYPIYLKVAFELAKNWKSYDKEYKLKPSFAGVLIDYFEALEREHKKELVESVVCYLLSGKYKGLTENELLEVLAFDEEYWNFFLNQTHDIHRDELKELKTFIDNSTEKRFMKIPIIVWSRLFLDIEPFMTEKDADGVPVITYFHRQFFEVLEDKYSLTNIDIGDAFMSDYNLELAKYFQEKPLYIDNDIKKPNVRKLAELPYQQRKAEMWDEVTDTLCNLDFIQAKSAAKMTYVLIEDINETLEVIPENAERVQEENEQNARMDKYTKDLIAFAEGRITIDELDIPESITPWTEEKKDKEIERIKTNPNRADRIRDFQNFLGVEADNLHKNCFDFKGFAYQQGWNYAKEGPVGKAAENVSAIISTLLLRRTSQTRPYWNPLPQSLFTLKGHTDVVTSVAITPNGKRAISGSDDKSCIFWDLISGKPLSTLKGHTHHVKSVAITPDGKRAISGSKTCIIWDLITCKSLFTLKGHTSWVNSVAITPDGKRAISGSKDKTCIIWDLISGMPLSTLKEHTYTVTSVAITPDGKMAISSSEDATCILWDLISRESLFTLKGHIYWVNSISITPDGKRAISGSDDKTCITWDLISGKPIFTLKGHNSSITSVAISPDAKRAISASKDDTCIIWDLISGKPLSTLKGHDDRVTSVAITRDGKRAISGSWDNTCIIWDLIFRKSLFTLKGHTDGVESIAITPDGKRAISGSWDNTCIIWDVISGNPLFTLKGHTLFVESIAITPDGKRAISGPSDDTCIIWDLISGKPLSTLKGHDDRVTSVAITPDGKRAISGSWDVTCIIWDVISGNPLFKLKGHKSKVTSVAFTPNGKRAISGSCDNTCIIWDLISGKPIFTFKGHTNDVNSAAITPDGKRVISSSRDNSFIIWDLDSGEQLAKFLTNSGIDAVASYSNSFILWCKRGDVVFLNADKELFHSGTAITTIRRTWDFELRQYLPASADCPLCGNSFSPPISVLSTIEEIKKKSGLSPEQSPCFELPDEAWEHPGLLSTCPQCSENLKFNPFIAGGEYYSIQEENELDSEEVNNLSIKNSVETTSYQIVDAELDDLIDTANNSYSKGNWSAAYELYIKVLNRIESGREEYLTKLFYSILNMIDISTPKNIEEINSIFNELIKSDKPEIIDPLLTKLINRFIYQANDIYEIKALITKVEEVISYILSQQTYQIKFVSEILNQFENDLLSIKTKNKKQVYLSSCEYLFDYLNEKGTAGNPDEDYFINIGFGYNSIGILYQKLKERKSAGKIFRKYLIFAQSLFENNKESNFVINSYITSVYNCLIATPIYRMIKRYKYSFKLAGLIRIVKEKDYELDEWMKKNNFIMRVYNSYK